MRDRLLWILILSPLLLFATAFAQQNVTTLNFNGTTLRLNGTLTIDQESSPSDPLEPIITPLVAILVGGAGVLITYLANYWAKNREERITMAKYKIDAISKSKPLLIQKARFSGAIYRSLTTETAGERRIITDRDDIDYTKTLYYLCCFLCTQQRVFFEFGDLQLDDLDAEAAIGAYENKIVETLLNSPIINHQVTTLAYLAEKEMPYDNFSVKVRDSQILSIFEAWIRSLSEREFQNLAIYCRAYHELLTLEFNHVYKIWYGKDPSTTSLAASTLEHVSKNYKEYYAHIEEFDMNWRRRAIRKLKRGLNNLVR